MTDPIDRDAALEIVKRTSGDYAAAWSMICKLPTIDAAPVRHATRIPSKKHLWRLDEKGEIDIFAMDYGYCNGPVCRVCGHSFCVHCNGRDLKFHPDRKAVSAFDEETCDEHLICSECGRIIGPNEPYCHCGAKMDNGGTPNAVN